MKNQIFNKLFQLENNNTNIRKELLAGFTTFFTMSYLLILSPKILANTGLNFDILISITAITVFICCLLMGFIANKPFATGPFLGDSAFISYTLVLTMGISINKIFASIFISGILLFIFSISNIRIKFINLIPNSLKLAYCIGLGLFFISISLRDIGIIKYSHKLIPVECGNLITAPVILGIFCFIILISLIKHKIQGAVIISILATTIIGILIGDVKFPDTIISIPHNLSNSLFQLDFNGLFTKEFIPIFFVLFILINIGTSGSLISLMYNENNTNFNKPMIVDSLSVIISPILGTTTSGAFMDSMTGIQAGGRTGLTAIVCGVLFFLGLFFSPMISIIPSYAYAPALLYVGLLLISLTKELDFSDISEYSTVFVTISIMIFTNNIGIGIMTGFFIWPILKLMCGQLKKTNVINWILCLSSIIFFIAYPYNL